MTVPECPGCGRPAPAPDSEEAAKWMMNKERPLCVCPTCAAPETLQQVEDEQAKGLADATGADVEWLRDEALRQADQARAWVEWFQALPVEDEEGEA
jgi:hypothetical protein